MKRPGFLEGVAVALVTSVAGSVVYTALVSAAPGVGALRLVIAGAGFAYVLYLLARSRQRVGRVTTVAAWLTAATLIWLAEPPLTLYLLAHLGAVWIVRSLYFYSSLLSALADLGLNALSLAAAIWALVHSGSLFLAIWSLFLVQALFVAIPASLGPEPGLGTGNRWSGGESEDRFQRAHSAAEAAVRKLSSIR